MLTQAKCISLAVAASVAALGYLYVCSSPLTISSHSIEFAQIIGAFAGLGLTAISVIAAIPIDAHSNSLKRKADKLEEFIGEMKSLPNNFARYLAGQMITVGCLIVIGIVSPRPEPTLIVSDYWKIADALTFGFLIYGGIEAMNIFSVLKRLSTYSMKRFEIDDTKICRVAAVKENKEIDMNGNAMTPPPESGKP